jgi:hypothetical protein
MDNKHVTAIPAELKTEAQKHIDAAKENLLPYVQPLTPAERQGLTKMGNINARFMEKSYDLAEANPALVPPYLNMEAFAIDKSDALGLRVLHNSTRQLEEYIADTEMLAGSEAYHASLIFYNYVKGLATQDIPGAKAVYEELKTFFHRTRAKKQE